MDKPKKRKTISMSIEMPEDLMHKIDELKDLMQEHNLAIRWTRTHTVRSILHGSIDHWLDEYRQ